MKLNIHLPDPTPLHHLECISLGQKKRHHHVSTVWPDFVNAISLLHTLPFSFLDLFFCLCTVRRRLKSLEEEVQKLEEEQQLGLTLCLLIWMMWMLLPSWERAASRSLRPLWQFFEDEDFPNFPRWDLPVFLEDQYFFSEYMIHAVSMQLCSFLLLGGLLGLP